MSQPAGHIPIVDLIDRAKSFAAAQAGRDKGMTDVERAANEVFKATMRVVILKVAGDRAEFISDDLWDVMDRDYPDVRTHENRVMGPLLKNAVRDGICEKTGQYRQGRRRSAHATPQPVYRSLVYREATG